MSDELCNSKSHLSSLVVSDLTLLCSSIFSNPLYISYFIFFSPYLLRLVSFLSPLFLTTFLILLAGIDSAFTSPVLANDDLGIYDILFGGTCSTNCLSDETPLQTPVENPEPVLDNKDSSFCKKIDPVSELKNACPVIEEKRLESFLRILDQFEKMSTNSVDEKKKKKIGEGVRQNAVTATAHSQRIVSSNSEFESLRRWDHNNNEVSGSMRKEKEWKRTLACKLFEERHNVDGGEGMDSLWEAYETNSNKPRRETKGRGKKTSGTEVSEDEDEDEGVVDGQLCCLHAIKFSAGKMNLGMGKPNLVKISKAIKGFGWLHRVTKYSKKVHNNVDK